PSSFLFLLSILPPPPCSPLFPYTTLFRSLLATLTGFLVFYLYVFITYVRASASRPGATVAPTPLQLAIGFVTNFLDTLGIGSCRDRKSTRLNSSHRTISYAVFCLKKKTKT